jgi:hypothetical protein
MDGTGHPERILQAQDRKDKRGPERTACPPAASVPGRTRPRALFPAAHLVHVNDVYSNYIAGYSMNDESAVSDRPDLVDHRAPTAEGKLCLRAPAQPRGSAQGHVT